MSFMVLTFSNLDIVIGVFLLALSSSGSKCEVVIIIRGTN